MVRLIRQADGAVLERMGLSLPSCAGARAAGECTRGGDSRRINSDEGRGYTNSAAKKGSVQHPSGGGPTRNRALADSPSTLARGTAARGAWRPALQWRAWRRPSRCQSENPISAGPAGKRGFEEIFRAGQLTSSPSSRTSLIRWSTLSQLSLLAGVLWIRPAISRRSDWGTS